MIPIKLVETVFQRFWALILPAALVPVLVVALTNKPAEYRSTAVVWVSSPVAGESNPIGFNNAYLTPAQNRAQVLNDLMATESFRVAMVKTAGLAAPADGESGAKAAARRVKIWASATGANLVTISATSMSAEDAQSVVSAAITEFGNRANLQFQKDSSLSTAYYQQQLAIANEELAKRQAAVADYLAAHPKAAVSSNPEALDINYRALVDRVTSQITLVNQLQASLQTVQLREASAPQAQEAAFTVQDAASLPLAPLPTSMTKTVGLPFAGLLFGLLIGCAYLYFAYRTDHSIRFASDLEGFPVRLLGSVPELHAAPSWLRWTPIGWLMDWRQRDFARRTAVSITGSPSKTRNAKEA